ncbi:MAG TPA: hypothetical protein VJZ76_16100 [Thermoanaerobaculia bacterium]|nr:hypothetical protein [Thermoanaerobaculia bacterium]
MAFNEQLSVITPVSRPQLLPAVGSSVPSGAEWILVSDGAMAIPDGLRPHILICGPRTTNWGHAQRALGLEAATRRFVYFLDDDNVMLPSLGELLIPYLERYALAGALFGILIHASTGRTHVWPAPPKIRIGRVDTAMFLGRREEILQLQFSEPVHARGWPNVRGREGDFLFLKAYEAEFGLTRLPALYGFHNGLVLLQKLQPWFFRNIESELKVSTVLETLLNAYLIRTDVPPWW